MNNTLIGLTCMLILISGIFGTCVWKGYNFSTENKIEILGKIRLESKIEAYKK